MTLIDLHPEDLLDKAERGHLSDVERTRLDAHLARCAACRAEQLLRADFGAELLGEDRPSAILGIVQGALAAPPPANTQPGGAKAVEREVELATGAADERLAVGIRRRSRISTVLLLVAAAILVASVAGAATGVTARVWQTLRPSAQDATHGERTLPTETAEPRVQALPRPAGAAAAPGPAPEVAPSPAPVPEIPSVVVASAAPSLPLAAAAPRVEPKSVVSQEKSANAVASPAPFSTVAQASSAADLFDSANAARRAGDTASALSRYVALERQFPNSREARVAKATVGRLLLDRGDAAGALGRFDDYLRSGAAELREECMAGRATALERLGRGDEEARAWAALLAEYPHTPFASHAKARAGAFVPQ
jgi:TolA-binding protein